MGRLLRSGMLTMRLYDLSPFPVAAEPRDQGVSSPPGPQC